MAYVGTMTDTAAQDGVLVACASGASLADGSAASSQMAEGGAAGTGEQVVKNSAGVSGVVGFGVQSAPGEPGSGTWEAGDWIVRHPEVTTGNTSWTWQEVHICEIRPDGTVAGTVASSTGLAIAMSAGLHSTTVSQGSDYTPAGSDSEIYIVYVYDVGGAHGNEQFGVTPGQAIDTPITTATPVSASHPAHYEHPETALATAPAFHEHLQAAAALHPSGYEHLRASAASASAFYERLQTALATERVSYEHLAAAVSVSATEPAFYEHLIGGSEVVVAGYEHLSPATAVVVVPYEHRGAGKVAPIRFVTPVLDGGVEALPGPSKRRTLYIPAGEYPTPFWVRFDQNPAKVVQVAALPRRVVATAAEMEVLSAAP